ncbi:hypothetical protein I302_103918 [Kwoniella bestiolae CBS 10118]|uniref:TPR-like protein n=1 Tax=Kwoniella bestiolae CBS 10118 TaxID=1296100 RepID=A0AAJ8M8R5_9TREE
MSTLSAAGPSPKGIHYNTSLTAALLRGAWAESNPGHAPNKTELSWGELVRKWGKHTGGNTSLIHHLRDISLLYLSSTSHSTTSSSGYLNVSSEAPGSSNSSNDSAGTANTGTGSHSSQWIKYDTSFGCWDHLQSELSKFGRFGRGRIGRYEGNLWWNGVGSEGIDEVKEGIKSLEGLIGGGKLSEAELTSARFTLAYHFHALGSHEDALRIYEGIDWKSESRFGVVQGDSAVLERIRARCLQGLSYELAQNPDYQKSIQSYLLTVPLLQSLSSYSLPLPSYLSNQQSPRSPFEPQREVYRWISTALTRAAVLSARQSNPTHQKSQDTLRTLRTYHAFTSSWPATFRPIQRQRMLLLYLRSLDSSYPYPRAPPPESPLLYSTSTPSTSSSRVLWTKEVVEAIHQGRALLQSTTTFPRAGSINRPVTEFAEVAVSLYSKSAELGREVISLLWWSMTLTFQSQTVLRHLTHLLADIGDSQDAKRVFELYVQLVLKFRETQQPEVSLQLKRRPTNEDAASPEQIRKQLESESGNPEENVLETKEQVEEGESDSDREFIETLLGGTRLLARDLGEIEDAWRYVVLAGDVLNASNGVGVGITEELKARIEEAKGIVRMSLAVHTADSIDRPTYQAQAINHLTAAIDLFPSSSGYYHLAHCQSEARSIDAATQSIRSSLEMDPTNVQAWHLLALLLTARRDWEGALKACEAGISVWEADEEVSSSQEDLLAEHDIESKDFAIQPPTSTNPTISERSFTSQLINKDGSFPHLNISPPRTTPLSKSARLEHVIRLRQTLNVIIEKIQGPELAMLKQQELFAFFSARSGKNRKKMGYSSGLGKANGMKSVASSSSLTALPGTAATDSTGKEDLGGSFVSVGVNEGGTVSVQPPTPMTEKASFNPISLAPPVSEKPPITVQSPSPTPTPPPQSTKTGALTSEGEEEKSRRRSLSVRSKVHLHVPGHGQSSNQTVSAPASRPSSIRRSSNTTTAPTIQQGRERSASAAQSLAPTAIHSHFRNHNPSSRTILPPPPPIQQPSSEEHGRTPAESRILSNLWLMSAATFRRWGKMEQCLVAIEEAEVLDPENPDVWVQLGMYHSAINKQNPSSNTTTNNDSEDQPEQNTSGSGSGGNPAESSFVKSLLLKPDHSSAIIGLSKIYLESNQVDLAEILLNSLTQEKGWDLISAWYLLGKVSEAQGRNARARECWEFALGLERTGPVREWNQVGRWL